MSSLVPIASCLGKRCYLTVFFFPLYERKYLGDASSCHVQLLKYISYALFFL